MKKLFSCLLILALSAISLTACHEDPFDPYYDDPFYDNPYYDDPYYDDPYYNDFGSRVENIEGPWENNGFSIREIGQDKYEVLDQKKNISWYEYLDPFRYFENCVPYGCWPERCEPYYSTTKDELCWHVYCRGAHDEILIFRSGKYAPL